MYRYQKKMRVTVIDEPKWKIKTTEVQHNLPNHSCPIERDSCANNRNNITLPLNRHV